MLRRWRPGGCRGRFQRNELRKERMCKGRVSDWEKNAPDLSCGWMEARDGGIAPASRQPGRGSSRFTDAQIRLRSQVKGVGGTQVVAVIRYTSNLLPSRRGYDLLREKQKKLELNWSIQQWLAPLRWNAQKRHAIWTLAVIWISEQPPRCSYPSSP
jgi:hypothetical protein